MPSPESLEQRLSEFDTETVRAVIPPGADAVRQAVYRRERRRTAVAAFAAVVAVVTVIGLSTVVRPHPSVVLPGPPVTTSAPPSMPAQSSSPSADPPATTTSQRPPANPTAGPTSPAKTGPALRVSGPTSVTLTSDGTVYHGQLTLTVTNTGPPYSYTIVYLTAPAGVRVDFLAGDPGFGACVGAAAPETWACNGPSIPAGGTIHPVVHVAADYGPQASDLALPGFAIRYSVGNSSPESPPAGNRVTMTVVLSGT
jgi:hypothetical protein